MEFIDVIVFTGILIFVLGYAKYFIKRAEWDIERDSSIDAYLMLKAHPRYKDASPNQWKIMIENLEKYAPELVEVAKEDMKRRFENVKDGG